MTRDLSTWRQAHERIRESEERLQAFTDNSPAVMFLKDADGRYRGGYPAPRTTASLTRLAAANGQAGRVLDVLPSRTSKG